VILMDDVIDSTRAVLSATPARWRELAKTVPSELLERAPKTGEWSALDCLRHLVDTERWVFPPRVRAFLAGEDFAAFDPDAEGSHSGGQPAEALAEELARLRDDSLALLGELTAADLERTARHAELGSVTLGEMLHEWAAHDLMHTVQAERALMQPFIMGTGPWRGYFTDHDAGPPTVAVAAARRAIRFSSLHGAYGCFSNFAAYPITLKGRVWPTNEHYFQAQKFVGTEHEEAVRLAQTPKLAANMGRSRERPLRADWEQAKDALMEEAVRAKFTQHADLRRILLETGDAPIVEHRAKDSYWGDGPDGSGKNMLGCILMRVRDELRDEE
jgi:N-glycosidase YbiA